MKHAPIGVAGFSWRLVASGHRQYHDGDRKWANRELALADLTSEGWIIEGPHGKQPTMKHNADRHFFGYALKRTIH